MTDLELPSDLTPAPVTLFAADDPAVIVARATRIAETIKPIIERQHLFTRIQGSDHVQLEGWTLAGSLMPVGVFPLAVRTWEIGDDDGYGATVEARTMTGAVVGRADAIVMRSEEAGGKRKWGTAPAFQLVSMAQTRGSSKALRMPLGFVMKLAGYETTPAEEMEAAAARGEAVSGGKGVRPGWRDIAEQQRAHADLGELIDNLGARQWVAEWCDSKGYERPLAKGQLNQLRKAIEREFEPSAESSGSAASARPEGPDGPEGPPGWGAPAAPTDPGSRAGRPVGGQPPTGEADRTRRRQAGASRPPVSPSGRAEASTSTPTTGRPQRPEGNHP